MCFTRSFYALVFFCAFFHIKETSFVYQERFVKEIIIP